MKNKKLYKLITEYTYNWNTNSDSWDDEGFKESKKSFAEYYFENFKNYIEAFDFEVAKKDKSWGFRWDQYVDDEIISMWDELSIESKIIIFNLSCKIADSEESAAIAQAGESW